jgi:hypothetical protein
LWMSCIYLCQNIKLWKIMYGRYLVPNNRKELGHMLCNTGCQTPIDGAQSSRTKRNVTKKKENKRKMNEE